jgi:Flp pilus assembly protein TadG
MFSEEHKKGNTERGAVLVLVTLGIFFILGLAALVIDLGFLFVTRNQLHVAADSGSLGGAAKLADSSDCANTSSAPNYPARLEAQKFAGFHRAGSAAGQADVLLDLNTSNAYVADGVVNSSDGDIVVGNFTRGRDPAFLPCPTSDGSAVNAVRVHARRNSNSGTGIDGSNAPVTTFFAPVLNINTAGVQQLATAINGVRGALPICIPSCFDIAGCSDPLSPCPAVLNTQSKNVAWTGFPNNTTPPVVNGYIDEPFSIPCEGLGGLLQIDTTQGTLASSIMKLEEAFLANRTLNTDTGRLEWCVTLPLCGDMECSFPYTDSAVLLEDSVTYCLTDVIRPGQNNPPPRPCGSGTTPGTGCTVGYFTDEDLSGGQCSYLVE